MSSEERDAAVSLLSFGNGHQQLLECCRSVILARDVVLSHARLQGGSLQPQTSRRTIRAADLPFRSLQCLYDPVLASAFSVAFEFRTCREAGAALSMELRHVDIERVSAGKDDGPLKHILQFPDIARPVVTCQGVQCRRRNSINLPTHALGVFLNKVARQEGYVFAAIPKRRNAQRENMQAVIKICAGTYRRPPLPSDPGWLRQRTARRSDGGEHAPTRSNSWS